MGAPIKTLVVDGDAPFREAIRALLENAEGMTVVGEAQDERAAIALVRELQPDVILLDVGTLSADGLRSVAQIRELSPESKVIMLGVRGQERLVLDAFRKGARGHLVKGESTLLEIVGAIRSVGRGDAILSPRMAGWILDEMAQKRRYRGGPQEAG